MDNLEVSLARWGTTTILVHSELQSNLIPKTSSRQKCCKVCGRRLISHSATACSVNDRQLFRTTMVENDKVPLLLQYVHQGHRRHRREHDCRHRHLPPLPPYLTFAAAQRAMCTFPAVAASKNKKPKLAEPIPLGARGQKTPFPKLSETFIIAL